MCLMRGKPASLNIDVKVNCTLVRHGGYVQAVRPVGGVEVWFYSFLTTALEGGEGSVARPGHSLPPGKTWYTSYRKAVWAPGPVWTGAENLAPHWDLIPGPSSP